MNQNTNLKANAYINGKFIDTNNYASIYSAVDGNQIGYVTKVSDIEVNLAYEGAYLAFNTWKNISKSMRIKKIEEFAEFLIKDKAELARLMAIEIAKPYNDCIKEIERSYSYIKLTIDCFINDFVNPIIIDEKKHHVPKKVGSFYLVPIGVILAISPFNYPISTAIAKIIPAILTGNTVVFKPASIGSLVASQIAKYFHYANFIPGVFNLVTASGNEIGNSLITNKHLSGVTFTGSSENGSEIANNVLLKPLVLELGGKDFAIVSNNADLELSAKEIVSGAFNYNGQRCTAIKGVLVTNEVANNLVDNILKLVIKLKTGHPLKNADITAMISKTALNYNLELIEDAIKKQAKVLYGNQVIGYNILKPTVIDYINPNCRIMWEEQFGPVLPIIRVNTVNEAIAIVNANEYGLQASVFTKDKEEAITIAKCLEVGSVNINRSSSRGPDIFPFIGIKKSGFGYQGVKEALKSFTRIKGIVDNW